MNPFSLILDRLFPLREAADGSTYREGSSTQASTLQLILSMGETLYADDESTPTFTNAVDGAIAYLETYAGNNVQSLDALRSQLSTTRERIAKGR